MPMNNLSELSKPVRIHHDWNRASMRHCGKCDQWEMTVADADGIQTCASCYDAEWLSEWQNYAEAAEQRVSALLADNEAKDKRILELERANQSQDDHINQQQDRIDSLENTNAGLGRWLAAAEKRLATPVRLPPLMDGELFGKNSATANAHNNAITACSIAIRGAGFKSEATALKCVGDEQ
ncbi:hypothetical protein F0336_14290 [Serratia liquefaciens]|uniref:hypothetical protein n=1 Tax=Serratia liquefaciens TaxID=614 RepID=UPI0011F364C2|nr:hypothetical protein [Serratia liquefaciens]QIC87546.1 hypothetical protein F0336_14290 [Serratia liquefaciens]